MLYATNKQAFVNIMMLEELGLVIIDPIVAIKCGVATLISFMIFGTITALPYIISAGIIKDTSHPWIATICVGAFLLFSLGFMKAQLIGLNKWKAGLEVLIIGGAITAIGYAIGFAFPS